MIERRVDPGCQHTLDMRKVHHHAKRIQFGGLQGDDGPAVMPVEVPALTLVAEQAVAITELNLTRHAVHGSSAPLPSLAARRERG